MKTKSIGLKQLTTNCFFCGLSVGIVSACTLFTLFLMVVKL